MSEMIQVKVEAKKMVLDWISSNAYIQVNKKLLRSIGDTATILLAESISQYQRWDQKGKLEEDGSFYWTQMDCEIETGYSRSTQNRSYKDMQKRGLLETYNKQVCIKGKDRSVRFIKLYFNKIAELMFADDTEIIESIKAKYADLKEKNQESKKKAKEKSMIQNDSSLGVPGVIQNESSGSFKMNHADDSKCVASNNNNLIKPDKSIKPDSKKNLSILKEVKALNIPSRTVSMLEKQIDRLMLHQINPDEIELAFNQFKDQMGHEDFNSVLYDVLQAKKINSSFKKYLEKSLNNLIANRLNKEAAAGQPKQPIRKEMIPAHMEDQQEQEKDQEQIEKERQELEEMLEAMKEDRKTDLQPDHKPKKSVKDILAALKASEENQKISTL